MKIICAVLGHKPPRNFGPYASMGGGDYLELDHPHRDHIGRVHLIVLGNCLRCGDRYKVGMMHLYQAERFMRLNDEVKP